MPPQNEKHRVPAEPSDVPELEPTDDPSAETEDTTTDLADRREILVTSDANKRLDVFLQSQLKGISRSRVQKLIDLGGVTLNGAAPKASTTVHCGDVIGVILPPVASRQILPEPIPLDVIFEDNDFIVINKQAGLIVHPARSNLSGTLINGLAYRFKQQVETAGGTYQHRKTRGFRDRSKGKTGAKAGPDYSKGHGSLISPMPANPVNADNEAGPDDLTPRGDVEGLSNVGAQEFRPGVIHRLDKNTTGVIVVAKNDETHWMIARQFEDRTTLKAYLAIIHGNPDTVGGAVEAPIGKHPTIREAMAVRHDSAGKHALTLYRVRERYRSYSLVELELKTGRTHQIRIHMAYIGHPIIGDILYGGEPIGRAELDNPPTPAARRGTAFAREKTEGKRIESVAAARPDILLTHPALHAALLRFRHPRTHELITFTAPVHEPLRSLLAELRKRRIDEPVATEGYWTDLSMAVPATAKQ